MESFFEKIKTIFYSLIYGIKNCIKWFPIVWKDRNWDELYIYMLLQFKLKNMEMNFQKYGMSDDNDEIMQQLKKSSELCDRLINYDYDEDALHPFYQKYPNFEIDMTTELKPDGLYSAHFNTEDLPDADQKLYYHCLDVAESMRKQDREALFALMNDKIDGWWN